MREKIGRVLLEIFTGKEPCTKHTQFTKHHCQDAFPLNLVSVVPNKPSAHCQQNVGNVERALRDREEEKRYKLL